MLERKVTLELVRNAVEELKAEGSKISTLNTYEKLGRIGSYTTIQNRLVELEELERKEKEDALMPLLLSSTDDIELPPPAVELAKHLFAAAYKEAEAKHRDRVASLEESLAQAESRLAAERDSLAAIEKEREEALSERNGANAEMQLAMLKRDAADNDRRKAEELLRSFQEENVKLKEELREVTDKEKQEEAAILKSLKEENSLLREQVNELIAAKTRLAGDIEARGKMEDIFRFNDAKDNAYQALKIVEKIYEKIESMETAIGEGVALHAETPKEGAAPPTRASFPKKPRK